MSATPAPGGSTPKSSTPKPPPPSVLRRFGPQLALVGGAVGLFYVYYSNRAPSKPGAPGVDLLRTPGVANIERAYSNGGATPTHTPAYGGTPMGDHKATHLKEGSATGQKKGMDTEGLGKDQRAADVES